MIQFFDSLHLLLSSGSLLSDVKGRSLCKDNFNMMGQNKLNTAREDSEGDLKSMSSSMRSQLSTHSGMSDVDPQFPVPADTSPTYENLLPAGTLLTPVLTGAGAPKRKLPQLPPDNRRTRKDGLMGEGRGGLSRSVRNIFILLKYFHIFICHVPENIFMFLKIF